MLPTTMFLTAFVLMGLAPLVFFFDRKFAPYWYNNRVLVNGQPCQKIWRMKDEEFKAEYAPLGAESPDFLRMVLHKFRGNFGIEKGKPYEVLTGPEQDEVKKKAREVFKTGDWRRKMEHYILVVIEDLGWVGPETKIRRQIVQLRLFGKHNLGKEKYWLLPIVGTELGHLVTALLAAVGLVLLFSSATLDLAMRAPFSTQYVLDGQVVTKEKAQELERDHRSNPRAYPELAREVPTPFTFWAAVLPWLIVVTATWFFLYGLDRREHALIEQKIKEALAAGSENYPKYRKIRSGFFKVGDTKTAQMMYVELRYAGMGPGGHFTLPFFFTLFYDRDDDVKVTITRPDPKDDTKRISETVSSDEGGVLGEWQIPCKVILELGELSLDYKHWEWDSSSMSWKCSSMVYRISHFLFDGEVVDPDIERVDVSTNVQPKLIGQTRSAIQDVNEAFGRVPPPSHGPEKPFRLTASDMPGLPYLLQALSPEEIPFPFRPQEHQGLITRLAIMRLNWTIPEELGLKSGQESVMGDPYNNERVELTRDELAAETQLGNALRVKALAEADADATRGAGAGRRLQNMAPGIERVREAVGGDEASISGAIAAGIAVLPELRQGGPNKDKDPKAK